MSLRLVYIESSRSVKVTQSDPVSTTTTKYICLFVCMEGEHATLWVWGQRIVCRTQFSPSVMGVLGIELRSFGLVASPSAS